MFERFAGESRDVVIRARAEAQQAGAGFVGTEHMLMALLDPEAGRPYEVLHAAGVRLEVVRSRGRPAHRKAGGAAGRPKMPRRSRPSASTLTRSSRASSSRSARVRSPLPSLGRSVGLFGGGGPRFSNRAKKVLELAVREAVHGGSTRGRVTSAHVAKMTITTEHILLGLIREGDGLAAKILTDGGVKLSDLRTALLEGRDKAA